MCILLLNSLSWDIAQAGRIEAPVLTSIHTSFIMFGSPASEVLNEDEMIWTTSRRRTHGNKVIRHWVHPTCYAEHYGAIKVTNMDHSSNPNIQVRMRWDSDLANPYVLLYLPNLCLIWCPSGYQHRLRASQIHDWISMFDSKEWETDFMIVMYTVSIGHHWRNGVLWLYRVWCE